MTQIKKITDKQGNDIYLRTHTKAVIDDNGYTAESRLQAMQDEINAKQIELGSVQSDLYPIKNSPNYVTSGGVYNELYVDNSYTPNSDEYYNYRKGPGSIGSVSGYRSDTTRVTINIPQDTSFINFTKIAGGYHVALQEWITDNPNASIPDFSGTFSEDSGWIESSSIPVTITKKVQASNYLVVAIAKTASTAITIQEALDNVSFTCEMVYNKCDNLANELSKLQTVSERVDKLTNRKYVSAGTNVKIVAHRGFHLNNVPENSLDAYMWAGLMSFDIAETDFCPTSDNELVLMHDASINRTMKNADYTNISGTVNVNSKTLAELRENYVLASDDVRYRKPIPTLEEYYITCRESGLFALPEIKSSGTTQAHVLAAYNMGMEIMGEGNFGFCSSSYSLLDYVRRLSDTIPLWYIGNSIIGTTNSITGGSRESKYTIWYPSYNGYSFSSTLVKQYKAKGMKVAVWTVPVTQCDNVIKAGVDYIAADVIGSNIVKNNGNSYNELDFKTNGVREDGIQLTSGQYALLDGDIFNIGVYYISILASGNYTIAAPNLSLSINDENYTRRIFQGIIDNKSSSITITANDETNIQSSNVKIVRIN